MKDYIYIIAKDCYHKIQNSFIYVKRNPYLNQLSQIVDDDTSIISSNCFAGRIMQDLHMELIIIGMDQNLCTKDDMLNFDKLPFLNKIFFSSHGIKGNSIVNMNEFAKNESVGDPYPKGHIFYKYFIEYFSRKMKTI